MTDLTNPFAYESLWQKSKVLIDRAIESRDSGDGASHYLWSAIALEILGKAALASTNPMLVADPNSFDSLLVALGKSVSIAPRSITAKTLYSRSLKLVDNFRTTEQSFCMLMAEKRNEYLHSGLATLGSIEASAWVPKFWRVSQLYLHTQEKEFNEWLGDEEAARVKKIIDDSSQLIVQTVLARVERRKKEFDDKYPPASNDREHMLERSQLRVPPISLIVQGDEYREQECPSCGCRGWLLGYSMHEEFVERVYDGDEEYHFAVDIIRTEYAADFFECLECGLKLEGEEELRTAGLPTEFEIFSDREPEFEEDYGNE